MRPVMGGEDFTATIAETRAELDGVAVLWNDADELTIFTKTAHNRHYKVKSLSNGNRSATFGYVGFSGNDGSAIENNYAVYPYDADATLAGEIITTKINAEQVYNAEKIDLSNALMAAKSTSSALQFVNSTALMRFDVANNMPDSYTLSSIKLVSAANKIAGEATINLSTDSKAVVTENGVNEVTLSGINTPITAEKQAFYVVLPATSFAAKDLTVTFTYAEGVEKSFALPAFDLELGSIKTIAYTINEGEDFEGSTPDSGEDFEGETPGTSDANKIITYKAPDRVVAAWNDSTFGASIVSHEFDSDTMLGTITCDDVVTTIGANAFNGVTLFGITIPSTVTSIGDLAFIDTHLLSVVIPDSVISIGIYAFQNTNLTSITIPDSVTTIGEEAFYNCSNLTSVYCKAITPPAGGYDMFSSNASDRKIYVPYANKADYLAADIWRDYSDSIIGYDFETNTIVRDTPNTNEIFYTTTDGSVVTLRETARFGANVVSNEYKYGRGVITFDADVTTVGVSSTESSSAFGNNLKSIILPSTVTTLGDHAFDACMNLSDITLPEGLESIYASFPNCHSLTTITLPTTLSVVMSFAFINCSTLTAVYCPANYCNFQDQAFDSCPSDLKIYVPTDKVDYYKSYCSIYADKFVGYDF